ncbi:MAG: hypothetical protein LUG99_12495 [Lachnospiraceae bacterium]|nr:hypothetical protein [Lachnospiraceae bacterium]
MSAENKNLVNKNSIEYRYIKKLQTILQDSGIPSHYYGMLYYKEEAICLEKSSQNAWCIYEAERGNKYNIRSHGNLYAACLDLIERISESEDQKQRMTRAFNQDTDLFRYDTLLEYPNRDEIVAERWIEGYHTRKENK